MNRMTMIAMAVLAAGCAQTVTPHYDMRFGAALTDARMAMTIDPAAGARPDMVKGIDGRSAQEAMKRYQDSFKEPPPATNVINIGGMIGGGGGGGR